MGIVDVIMEEMVKSMKRTEKDFARMLKSKSDDEIVRAIRNAEKQGKQKDYHYKVLCEEAYRRGLSF